jgi:hypothetical protein
MVLNAALARERQQRAERENDREPDQPHGHLDRWLVGV